ncbi:hypothetical protein KGF54_005186 [Candida jiufengensis]|uniref:uncharacterized protein n=1 Tax=Candida jiufengensis TaxID=497108 RepID=UPI002224EFF4|nr:uncharacterized protein KGF54_005186 [Candida jiufengensis]KAI5950229.1 hypothetical protein KGF54_005186 [Candida jiufengensis]
MNCLFVGFDFNYYHFDAEIFENKVLIGAISCDGVFDTKLLDYGSEKSIGGALDDLFWAQFKTFCIKLLEKVKIVGSFKTFWLVMNINPMIEDPEFHQELSNRGFNCLWLPSFMKEFNPINDFWSLMNRYSLRNSKSNDPKIIIMEVIQSIPKEEVLGKIKNVEMDLFSHLDPDI